MQTSPCLDAEVRFDIENACGGGARLIQEVQPNTGGSKPNESGAPARRPRGAFPQRGEGGPIVAEHDVAVPKVAEHHRIDEGIQPHRSLHSAQTVERPAGHRQHNTIKILYLRRIWIELQRMLVGFYGLIGFAAPMED